MRAVMIPLALAASLSLPLSAQTAKFIKVISSPRPCCSAIPGTRR